MNIFSFWLRKHTHMQHDAARISQNRPQDRFLPVALISDYDNQQFAQVLSTIPSIAKPAIRWNALIAAWVPAPLMPSAPRKARRNSQARSASCIRAVILPRLVRPSVGHPADIRPGKAIHLLVLNPAHCLACRRAYQVPEGLVPWPAVDASADASLGFPRSLKWEVLARAGGGIYVFMPLRCRPGYRPFK